jgi:hypothetical protein
VDRLDVSLIAAPVIFVVTAWLTRAPLRRIAGALAGGVAFAVGNAAIDEVAHHVGWWWYPHLGGHGHAPALWYAAAGLAGAGVSMIGWRVHRRFAVRGVVVFLGAFGLFCIARDARVAAADDSLIVFGAGALPRLADGLAGVVLMLTALAIQLALGGPSLAAAAAQHPDEHDRERRPSGR